jgi:membrane-associated phospholipid phosphatase
MTAARRQAGADDGGMSAAPGGSRRDVLLALLLGAVSVAAYLLYPVLNHGPGRIFLRAPLDRAIPLVPVMVIPYLSLIPLIILAAIVAAAAGLRRFQAFALAITLALAVSYLIYALAQSYVIRPSPAGTDWLTAAVRHVYSLDRPYNDFPSLHTSLSAIVAVSWWRIHRRTGIAIALWCTLIIASTVLIHQHYLADIAGGLAVAGLALAASDRIIGAIHHDQAGRARTQGQGRSAPGRRLR